MSDYLIEVLAYLDPSKGTWTLFNRTDSMSEARKLAAKAMLKTNYLAVRIRQKILIQE